MGYAQICPICNGRGKIKVDYQDNWNRGSSKEEKPCHGCGGKGWIDVQFSYPNPCVPYWPQIDYHPKIDFGRYEHRTYGWVWVTD